MDHPSLLYPIADPGYESDTGERDTPTLTDFKTRTPVTVVLGKPLNKKAKVMNRRGRAICRIMFAHGWSYKAIAYIFRISETSIQRAVENIFYRPPLDRIEEDLERAGPEWRGALPPPTEDGRPKVLKAKAGSVLAPLQQPNAIINPDASDEEEELRYPEEGSSNAQPELHHSESEFSSNARLEVGTSQIQYPEGESSSKAPPEENEYLSSGRPHASPYFHPTDRSVITSPQRTAKRKCDTRIKDLASEYDNEDADGEIPTVAFTPYKRIHEAVHTSAFVPPTPPPSASRTPHHSDVLLNRNQFPAKKPRRTVELLTSPRPTSQDSTTALSLGLSAASHSQSPVYAPHSGPSQLPVHPQDTPLRGTMLPPRSLPLPRVSPPNPSTSTSTTIEPPTPSLPELLKTVTEADFTAHLPLLAAQGFTAPRVAALARAGWTVHELHEGLERLLLGRVRGRAGMTAYALVQFEAAVKKLAKGMGAGPAISPPLPLPPPGVNPANSGTTLPLFLKNVMGLDLSAHVPFFEMRGVGIAALSKMRAKYESDADPARLRDELEVSLLDEDEERWSGGKGVSPLEVVALEFSIRRG
ncbi:hypothetical protein DFH08DRAFT_250002 [Mycena albidolilacea]|uniref:Uncharacterized protein n=1 Tax=Mycena albidolilacea TaxID=1033008 RepID=A0AAD6ZTG5_9AGAR|nr:hypothetical protein DFH08DRAFT_250002 [Mycena albidolilacea]